jgi:hypothetical protein
MQMYQVQVQQVMRARTYPAKKKQTVKTEHQKMEIQMMQEVIAARL